MTSTTSTDARLYVPDAFKAADPHGLVCSYPFALLITSTPAGIEASSTPLFFVTDADRSVMVGHLARKNPQAERLHSGQNALAVFAGPHTYISSSWYEARPTVPTWNYVAAHVRGTIEPVDDPEGSLAILRRTADALERGNPNPWTLEQAPAGKVETLLPFIRAFRLSVTGIEGVTKLSQTHPASDRMRVIRHLLDRCDGNSTEIARLMTHLSPCD